MRMGRNETGDVEPFSRTCNLWPGSGEGRVIRAEKKSETKIGLVLAAEKD